jgi:MFS family permease
VLGKYAEVLRTPGAMAFSGAGLVARLPMSMFGLSIVLAITELGGSYGRAGIVAGIALVAHAVGSPLQARLADIFGQRRMLLPVLVLHTAGLIALIQLLPDAAIDAAPAVPFLAAVVVTGLTLPQVGALVRARWARLHGASPRLHTAYAWESVVDEVIFVVGPILAVTLATGVHGLAGLVAILIFTLVGGLAFAAQRSTEPTPKRLSDSAERQPLPVLTLAWIVVAFVFMGAIFGSVEVATVAFTEDLGAKGASGPVLAVFAAGSLLAGVITGAIHWRTSPRRRFVIGQAVLAAAVFPLAFVGSIPLLIPAIFIAGFGISPTLIAGFSMIEAEVPAARLTEGLAWVSTALGIGVAAGAAVAGPVIDRIGASEAFLVSFACGALATIACMVGTTIDRRPARERV